MLFLILFSMGILEADGFGFLGHAFPRTFHKFCQLADNSFDLSQPFIKGRISNAIGYAYEDDVRSVLIDCGYGSDLGPIYPNSALSRSVEGQYDLDVVCSGNVGSWDQLAKKLDCHFICDPPSALHTIYGECKVSSNTLTNWVSQTPLRGVSKFFNTEEEIAGGIKCIFVNGGDKSRLFVDGLSSDGSEVADNFRRNKVNVFYSPYLSSESVKEVLNQLRTNAEQLRTYAEQQRITDEQQQITAEQLRTNAEQLRTNAEQLRTYDAAIKELQHRFKENFPEPPSH